MRIAETERLLLRQVHVGDLDPIAALFADAEVMRFGPGPQDRGFARRWLGGCLEDYHRKWGFGFWAVVHKGERRVIGICGLTHHDDLDGRPEIELGYRLARSHWGRGLATEAARAVVSHSLEVLTLRRLVSIVDPENLASAKVAEKVGMRLERDVDFAGKRQRMYAMSPTP